jgi:hypothetical protein
LQRVFGKWSAGLTLAATAKKARKTPELRFRRDFGAAPATITERVGIHIAEDIRGIGKPRQILKPGKPGALVQGAATRARRQKVGRLIFELEGAQGAPEHVTERGALSMLAAPFIHQVGAKDRPEHEHEIDQDEIAEGDRDHGGEECELAGGELRTP